MSRVKYDSDSIKLITLFESMTGAGVKDCISNEKLVFIINENEMGKAIGKDGVNIKRMESRLRKKIRLVEFASDASKFVKNMIHPIEAASIAFEKGIITIRCNGPGAKAMLIGRERQNIMHLTDIVKRYFNVDDIRVV